MRPAAFGSGSYFIFFSLSSLSAFLIGRPFNWDRLIGTILAESAPDVLVSSKQIQISQWCFSSVGS